MNETIELAREPSFALGRLTVLPAQRELVRDDGQREVVEHRVMQVLIALRRGNGAITTRDELMALCWSGRVVSEDALNRVMSRLRKAAGGIGAGSFGIETIAKVGYRLVADGAVEGEAAAAPVFAPRRRFLLAGGAALGVAGLIGVPVVLRRERQRSTPDEVEALMTQASAAWAQGTSEGNAEAIGLYRLALERDPGSADSWGQLGAAYANRAHAWTAPAERGALRQRARAAGKRSMELDARNACGRAAIALAQPFRGHWLEMEQAFRQGMADQPDNWLVPYGLAVLLTQVGRFTEIAALMEQVRRAAPTVTQYAHQIKALSGAGRLEEAERLSDEAGKVYGANPIIWFARFDLKLFGGQADAAIQMASNPDSRPSDWNAEDVAYFTRLARAVAGHGADIAAVAEDEAASGRRSSGEAAHAIQNLSAIGRLDEAFTLADAYYFSNGFIIPDQPTDAGQAPTASLAERQTQILFHPSTRAMRTDPRFGRLAEGLGLERYWRAANSAPDFRLVEAG